MKALLRRLWFRRSLAGAGLPMPASAPGKDKVEADGLLARFYSSQEC
jgi:hypothetical protein